MWHDVIHSDVGRTAITVAISAAAFYAGGLIIAGLQEGGFGGVCYQVTAVTQASINAGAGALSGGINAAITGGDIGKGALTGGLSAGIAKFAGVELFQTSGYGDSILS